ncbi:secreted RxLR effector protein 161-like [Henckelia pumila]|uniref:secreted RxLR effector protein 161-like n=1 Tax=Henckelia pumila TaxID=405737 RepID=UPI003C6E55E8
MKKVLLRFSMNQSKEVTIPVAQNTKLSSEQAPKTEEERQEMNNTPYASGVGSIMYAMVCSRPDLAYAISLVSRFMSNPGAEHWKALKWVMKYLRGTSHLGLSFKDQGNNSNPIVGYVDADFAGNLDTRNSLTGFVFTLFGTVVTWKSTLQPVVALSTTEAEFIAVTEAIKEAI